MCVQIKQPTCERVCEHHRQCGGQHDAEAYGNAREARAAAVLLAAPPHPAREAASASEKRILNNVFFIEFPSFLCQVLLLYIRRTSRRYCVGTMSNRYQICNKRVFFGLRTRGRENNMLYWNT